MADSLVDQIDKCLGRLYQREGLEYDGTFKERCEENGFDDNEAISDELQHGPDDWAESQAMDADFLEGMFPWIPDGDNRNPSIYAIFVKCLKDPDAYDPNKQASIPNASDLNLWKLKEQDQNKVAKHMKETASSIWESGFETDGVLRSMVAVDLKMGRNYSQFLADMFMRQLIYQKHQSDKDYDIATWAKENKHISALTNMEVNMDFKVDGKKLAGTIQSPGDLACNAVKSYFHRVAPKLMLTVANKIKGDLKSTAEFILSTTTFVANLANDKQATCPFQYDAVFAFDELVEVDDDDEDEDDTDAVEDEDGNGDDDEKGDGKVKIDDIAGVVKELETLSLAYQPVAMSGRENARDLRDAFNEIQNQKIKGGAKDYPRNNRLCGLTDMRSNTDKPLKVFKRPKDDVKEDEEAGGANALMFESANNCNEVKTSSNSAMGYFHRAKTCIIPDSKNLEKAKMEAMSQGPHFTLSYHVDEQNDMRCYLYFTGQCARFLPEDIVLVLPLIFVDSDANKAFTESADAVTIIKALSKTLNDAAFVKFLEEYKVKYIPEELAERLK